MDLQTIEYCVLNVTASPHPQGIYVELLAQAATSSTAVNYWGDAWASISRPVKRSPGFFQGRVVSWTEIDTSEPGINKRDLSEIPFDDLNIDIPEYVGLNGKAFVYTLRELDHKIFVETKNELGKSLSPRRLKTIFRRLLSPDVLGHDDPFVEVTVVPDEDALSKILSIDKLRYLHIHIVRPNPDDIEADAEEILRELEEQNAKSQDVTLTVAPQTDGIEPNGRTKKQARVAAVNGYVEGRGTSAEGERVKRSTKEYPKLIRRDVGEYGSFLEAALEVATNTVIGQRRG